MRIILSIKKKDEENLIQIYVYVMEKKTAKILNFDK